MRGALLSPEPPHIQADVLPWINQLKSLPSQNKPCLADPHMEHRGAPLGCNSPTRPRPTPGTCMAPHQRSSCPLGGLSRNPSPAALKATAPLPPRLTGWVPPGPRPSGSRPAQANPPPPNLDGPVSRAPLSAPPAEPRGSSECSPPRKFANALVAALPPRRPPARPFRDGWLGWHCHSGLKTHPTTYPSPHPAYKHLPLGSSPNSRQTPLGETPSAVPAAHTRHPSPRLLEADRYVAKRRVSRGRIPSHPDTARGRASLPSRKVFQPLATTMVFTNHYLPTGDVWRRSPKRQTY